MPAVTNSHRIADTAIGQAQAINLADIAGERGFVLKRSGHELVGPCPLCGGVDRFAVNVTKGLYHCRGCGVGGRGAIAFVRWLDDAGFRDAVETLTGGRNDQINGLAVDLVRATADRDRRQHEKARWLWSQRQRITGSIAEAYLREARGITCALPPTLGFLQPRKADQHPAMIAAFGLCAEIEPGIIAAPSKVTAVHLTLLKTDGSGKAEIKPNKIMIGSPGGLPIIIAPPNDLLGLAITEGLEDALSVHQATGLGAWAAGAAGFMPKLADAVPSYIDCVTIDAHADKAGQDGAHKLAAKLRERGIEAFIEGLAA